MTQSGDILKMAPTMPLDAPRAAACNGGNIRSSDWENAVSSATHWELSFFFFSCHASSSLTSAGKNGPSMERLEVAMVYNSQQVPNDTMFLGLNSPLWSFC